MEKIALVTDSAADLSSEEIKEHNINIFPLRVIYSDREYRDRVDITPQEVYDHLSIEIPTTSLPSTKDIDDVFNKLKAEGYKDVLVVCISSGLSGTYNAITLSKERHPELNIQVYDSKTLSIGTGYLVLYASEMIKNGATLEEILMELPKVRENINLFYIVETLEYLIKGGRIGKVKGTIGELLNLKPIISVNDDGVYYTYSKGRGSKQAIAKLIEAATDIIKTAKSKIWVMHGGAFEEAQKLFNMFKNMPNVVSINLGDISPALGVHTGPGLLGIAVMKV